MTRDQAIELAKAHAQKHARDHAYLADSDCADWMPHEWVIDAVMAARPAAWGHNMTVRQLAEQVADVSDVHEALEAFSHDSTAENAIQLIGTVITATHGAEPADLPRAWGVTRVLASLGQRSVLVSFERALTDDELRALHDMLAGKVVTG